MCDGFASTGMPRRASRSLTSRVCSCCSWRSMELRGWTAKRRIEYEAGSNVFCLRLGLGAGGGEPKTFFSPTHRTCPLCALSAPSYLDRRYRTAARAPATVPGGSEVVKMNPGAYERIMSISLLDPAA